MEKEIELMNSRRRNSRIRCFAAVFLVVLATLTMRHAAFAQSESWPASPDSILAKAINDFAAGMENRLHYTKAGEYSRERTAAAILRALAAFDLLRRRAPSSNDVSALESELARVIRKGAAILSLLGTDPDGLQKITSEIENLTARMARMNEAAR